jgi:hypothetical protein
MQELQELQEFQELKSFAADLQGVKAEDVIYKLMRLKINAEQNAERKTRELMQSQCDAAERKTRELMQSQCDAVERNTRELMQLQCDAAVRNTRELMQFQIEALNEAKREVSNDVLRLGTQLVTHTNCQSQIAAAQLTTAINKEHYLKACLRTIGLRYVSETRHCRLMLVNLFAGMILSFDRFVTESLYFEISNRARDRSSHLHTFLKDYKTSDGTISYICKMVADAKSLLKLNQMDVLLCNKEIRAKIYVELNIEESELPYPTRHPDKSNYIYGYLSNAIHSPDFRTLWLRDDEDEDIKKYASFLANRYAMTVGSFDREAAASGCDDVCSETKTAPASLQSSGKSSTERRDNVDLLSDASSVAAADAMGTGGSGGLLLAEVRSVTSTNGIETVSPVVSQKHETDSDRPADGEEAVLAQVISARA